MEYNSSPSPTQGVLLLEIPFCSVFQIYQKSLVSIGEGIGSLIQIGISEEKLKVDDSSNPPTLDYFLILKVSDSFALPLTSSTKIFKCDDSSYLIPSPGLNGAFFKFTIHDVVNSPTLDSLEVLLSQWTSYQDTENHQKLCIIDDKDGSLIGLLPDSFSVQEDESLSLGDNKEPVIIELLPGLCRTPIPSTSSVPTQKTSLLASATSATSQLVVKSLHSLGSVNYKDILMGGSYGDKLIQGSEYVSQGILISASDLGSGMKSSSESYKNYRSNLLEENKIHFDPITKTHLKRIHGVSTTLVQVSAKTVGLMANLSVKAGQFFGSRVLGMNLNNPGKGIKGFVTKTFIAFGNILEGLEGATKGLISDSTESTATLVSAQFGEEAGELAGHVGGIFKNVSLIYIDAHGVSRKALLKTIAKNAVILKMSNGKDIILGSEAQQREVLKSCTRVGIEK